MALVEPTFNITKLALFYYKSLDFVVQTLATIGFGDIVGKNTKELCFAMLLIMIGQNLNSFILASLRSLGNTTSSDYMTEKNEALEVFFMQFNKIRGIKNINQKLVVDSLQAIHQNFILNLKRVQKEPYFQLLTPNLQTKLIYCLFGKQLHKFINFFGEDQEHHSFICGILQNLEFQSFYPCQKLIRYKESFECMYLIQLGSIDVYNFKGQYLISYQEGGFFGEFQIILGICSKYIYFTGDDKVSNVLYSIKKQKFLEYLYSDYSAYKHLTIISLKKRKLLRNIEQNINKQQQKLSFQIKDDKRTSINEKLLSNIKIRVRDMILLRSHYGKKLIESYKRLMLKKFESNNSVQQYQQNFFEEQAGDLTKSQQILFESITENYLESDDEISNDEKDESNLPQYFQSIFNQLKVYDTIQKKMTMINHISEAKFHHLLSTLAQQKEAQFLKTSQSILVEKKIGTFIQKLKMKKSAKLLLFKICLTRFYKIIEAKINVDQNAIIYSPSHQGRYLNQNGYLIQLSSDRSSHQLQFNHSYNKDFQQEISHQRIKQISTMESLSSLQIIKDIYPYKSKS